MDSVKLYTLRELAPVIKFAYAALRNAARPDPHDPSRGTLHMRYAQLPLFRLGGKSWLVRAADVDALINPPADTAAADEAPAAAARRPGRPRKAAATSTGGAQ
ncbi:MAG TPA: hypothetical protein PKE37_07270 [Thiomonas arsenitoxydans]|uniref:hypothetical protein n=1 Tax=Thiomonas TaxID=32012 RepID=UPI00257DB960|nr:MULTISPECIES: hypothetical protein [Thiomonas]HML81549.1 hypothetical protein [Thiomonas arsenitoxydans]